MRVSVTSQGFIWSLQVAQCCVNNIGLVYVSPNYTHRHNITAVTVQLHRTWLHDSQKTRICIVMCNGTRPASGHTLTQEMAQ
jgi:hypothetical protein